MFRFGDKNLVVDKLLMDNLIFQEVEQYGDLSTRLNAYVGIDAVCTLFLSL